MQGFIYISRIRMTMICNKINMSTKILALTSLSCHFVYVSRVPSNTMFFAFSRNIFYDVFLSTCIPQPVINSRLLFKLCTICSKCFTLLVPKLEGSRQKRVNIMATDVLNPFQLYISYNGLLRYMSSTRQICKLSTPWWRETIEIWKYRFWFLE